MALQSYTSNKIGLAARASELLSLSSIYRRSSPEIAMKAFRQFSSIHKELAELRCQPIAGLDVLEVGCGQNPMNLALFARENRAIGIDSEITLAGVSIATTLKVLRANGAMRVVKSMGRKALGLDKRLKRAFEEVADIDPNSKLDIRLMDASSLSFPEESFDIVFSRAVFEHIENPTSVTREARRVLRPGGTFYCLLHLYTSDNGCHDARIFSGSPNRPPRWAHLRSAHRGTVQENTFLNRWRLPEWKEMCAAELPGSSVTPLMDDASPERRQELAILRDGGELTEYSDEELLSPTLKVIWSKSAVAA
jgi:SAM-dependent methyltransferase